jgi:predicted patatin/cPLA2 family phospholipase
MYQCIVNGVKFKQDGYHNIWKEMRIWGNNNKKEVFFIPDKYITDNKSFERECQRIYNNYYL